MLLSSNILLFISSLHVSQTTTTLATLDGIIHQPNAEATLNLFILLDIWETLSKSAIFGLLPKVFCGSKLSWEKDYKTLGFFHFLLKENVFFSALLHVDQLETPWFYLVNPDGGPDPGPWELLA